MVPKMTTIPEPLQEPPDFSLVLGGPFYQMFRRANHSGPALELVRSRILCVVGITWLPIFLLSAIGGHLLSGPGLPFLNDMETQVRFLIAVPLLIAAELVVHQRSRSVIKQFIERKMIGSDEIPDFYATIATATRMRNAIPLEITLLGFAFTVGIWGWMNEVALGTPTWYAVPDGTNLHLTVPGYWYAFVSIPIGQFILFRWYLRLVIWFWLLWCVSRLNLRLHPAHADRAGGLGFLGESSYAFATILFAQGAVLAGVLANKILYEGQSLISFGITIAVLVGFFILVILGPLTMFTPRLARVKHDGLLDYGSLATKYVTDFDSKWLRGNANSDAILGSADIQSLSDTASSYKIVDEMRVVPFGINEATRLAAVTVLPLVPLLLTAMPLEELVTRLIKVIL